MRRRRCCGNPMARHMLPSLGCRTSAGRQKPGRLAMKATSWTLLGRNMGNHLSTYLHDHLAGARFAIDLLERLRDAYPHESVGQFAEEMRAQIEEDRVILQQLADEIGERETLKEATAWLAEKTARLKLRLGVDAELSVFESLEALSLGILGKQKLWVALQEIADVEPRVRKLNLNELAARAEEQHAQVEAFRLKSARTALRTDEKGR